MAQNKGILSLLDDDDDDDEEDETLRRSQPSQSNAPADLKAQWQGNAQYPKGTLPRLAPLNVPTQQQQHQQPQQQTQRPPSHGPPIKWNLLMDFCKQRFSLEEYKSMVHEFAGLKQSNLDSKEVLARIRNRIGPEGIQQFGSQVKAAAANGQSHAQGQPQHSQQVRQMNPQQQPQQQQQQQSSQQGSSIMQSLKYNAEQNRQNKPGEASSHQPPLNQFGQAGDVARQQMGSIGGFKHTLPSAPHSQAQAQAHAAVSAPPASVAAEKPAPASNFQPLQVQAPLPSVLGKQPEPPSQQAQPAPKRAKKDKDDIDDENDIFKGSGINLEEEQNALLGHKAAAETAPLPKLQTAVTDESFLNLQPLQIKLDDIARRHGLLSVDPQVGQLISRALETHLQSLIKQIFAMTRQRTDTDRTRPGMVLTGNLRKRLHELNTRERERRKEQEGKEADTQPAAMSKKKQAAEEAKKSDKAQMRDADKMQASAANAAAAAAFGSKAQKWGAWSTSAAKNPSSATQNPSAGGGKPNTTPSAAGEGATKQEEALKKGTSSKAGGADAPTSSFLPPSRIKAEMLSAKLPDLVAVMESSHMYQKSLLLYKLYDQLTE